MKISILQIGDDLGYAARELGKFLSEYTNAEIITEDGGDKVVSISKNMSMPAHHYSVHGNGNRLDVTGGNASSVLCGVYEALTRAGIFFEATGYSSIEGFDLDVFFSVNCDVKPKFRNRGVRQHINFPMDISSYSLKEAKEYIRSVARMRFNTITFHSYSGQWHEIRPDDPSSLAGHYFYGRVHPIPKNYPAVANVIGNHKYYCIPEVEEIFENEAAKGEYSKHWLNEVMKTAKEAYLTITLSLEVVFDDDESVAKMLRAVCETYPLIDTLELISEECGGFRGVEGVGFDNIKEHMVNNFGQSVLDENGNLPGLPDHLPAQLPSTAISVRRLLHALEIKDMWLDGLAKKPELRAGIYATCADTLRVLRPILRNRLPEGVTMSLLPAHGAAVVSERLADTGTLASDWQNTMFYTWSEFDGCMYMHQLCTDGIDRLVEMAEGESAYGFCVNHWKTVDNNLSLSYTAETAIGLVSPRDYYEFYAKKLGIEAVDKFVELSDRMGKLSVFIRNRLINLGFCFIGAWVPANQKVIRPHGYPYDAQVYARDEYASICEGLREILPTAKTARGVAHLRLMINRTYTSFVHLRAMITLDEIKKLYNYDDPQPISGETYAKIFSLISDARADVEEYIKVYGQLLPDRGGEGQVISYYQIVLRFVDAIESHFHGKEFETTDGYDAPPLPDAEA